MPENSCSFTLLGEGSSDCVFTMLQNTFCHLPGVGARLEQDLWQAGILTWTDYLHQCPPSSRVAGRVPQQLIGESLERLQAHDVNWFATRLPTNQTWRLFSEFRTGCAFVDIETTGLGSPSDHITTIAIYDGQIIRCYVRGHNLEEFARDIQAYSLVVTYNGTTFDLPFIERNLGVKLEQAHIDLRYLLASLGIKGGLKGCERQLGVGRQGLEEVDGAIAVLLWREFKKTGNQRVLETLLAYNVQDVVNLEPLLIEGYNRKLAGTPFAISQRLSAPPTIDNPYRPEPEVLRRLIVTAPWRVPFSR